MICGVQPFENAIYQDYLGPSPIFDDTLFQWIFRYHEMSMIY